MSLSQIQRLQSRGLTNLTTSYPASITLDGQPYAIATAGTTTGREVEVGGYMVEIDLTILLPKSAHPTKPIDGKKFTLGEKEYRIEKVRGDQAPHWTLECIDPNK